MESLPPTGRPRLDRIAAQEAARASFGPPDDDGTAAMAALGRINKAARTKQSIVTKPLEPDPIDAMYQQTRAGTQAGIDDIAARHVVEPSTLPGVNPLADAAVDAFRQNLQTVQARAVVEPLSSVPRIDYSRSQGTNWRPANTQRVDNSPTPLNTADREGSDPLTESQKRGLKAAIERFRNTQLPFIRKPIGEMFEDAAVGAAIGFGVKQGLKVALGPGLIVAGVGGGIVGSINRQRVEAKKIKKEFKASGREDEFELARKKLIFKMDIIAGWRVEGEKNRMINALLEGGVTGAVGGLVGLEVGEFLHNHPELVEKAREFVAAHWQDVARVMPGIGTVVTGYEFIKHLREGAAVGPTNGPEYVTASPTPLDKLYKGIIPVSEIDAAGGKVAAEGEGVDLAETFDNYLKQNAGHKVSREQYTEAWRKVLIASKLTDEADKIHSYDDLSKVAEEIDKDVVLDFGAAKEYAHSLEYTSTPTETVTATATPTPIASETPTVIATSTEAPAGALQPAATASVEPTPLPPDLNGVVPAEQIDAEGSTVVFASGVKVNRTLEEYLATHLNRQPTLEEYNEAVKRVLESSGLKDGRNLPAKTILRFDAARNYAKDILSHTSTVTETPTVTVTETPTETPVETPVARPVVATAPAVQPSPNLSGVKVELDNPISEPFKSPIDLNESYKPQITTAATPSISEANKLAATDKILLQTAPAAVNDHLDLTKKAVDDFLTSKKIDPSTLSADDSKIIRLEVQHELEAEANDSFRKVLTTEDIGKYINTETTGDVLSKGKVAFNTDLVTEEYQNRLLDRANKAYFQLQTIHQGAPAAVTRHLDQIDRFTKATEANWGKRDELVQGGYHRAIRSAAQQVLEKQANEDFIRGADSFTTSGNINAAVAYGNVLFDSHFPPEGIDVDLSGKVQKAISSAHTGWWTENIAIHDAIGKGLESSDFSKVPIDRDYGTVLFNHNMISDFGPASANVLGAEIAVNWDDLTSYWLETHPNGEYFPVSLSELDKLIADAQNGDTASLNKLKEALHYVKAGKTIKLLNQKGVNAIISIIKEKR